MMVLAHELGDRDSDYSDMPSAGGPQHTQQHSPRGLLTPLWAPLSNHIQLERTAPLFRRDPEFIRRQLAKVSTYTNLFSPEVIGLNNLPASGPVLLVGNHSCLFYMPDAWVVALSIIRRRSSVASAPSLRVAARPRKPSRRMRLSSCIREATSKRAGHGASATTSTSAGTPASSSWPSAPVSPWCPSSHTGRTTRSW